VSTAKKAATPRGIEDVLAMARPRQTEVRLCLAGDLAARADQLAERIELLGDRSGASSLADVDPRRALESELDEVHEAMRASEVVFRFRALGRTAYSDLLAAHEPRKGTDDASWNNDTYPHALIAACCIEPVMTVEQVDQLTEVLSQRQRNELFNQAWSAQVGETRVPISRAVSTSR
jgi:hypothetical protein